MTPPLSAAERRRQYRERCNADPERRRKYLEKEREKWRKDKETGKKAIAELGDRVQRAERKRWRDPKRILIAMGVAAVPNTPLNC